MHPNWQGALWKTLSCLSFSAINGIVGYLSYLSIHAHYPPLPSWEIALLQNIFGLFFFIPRLIQQPYTQWISPQWGLHLVRVFASALGLILWYTALACMPIAEAVFLGFLGPIINTLGACLLLKEPFGLARSVAIGMGVIGGLCISHAGYLSGQVSWYQISLLSLIPIGSAIAFSLSTLMAKHLTRQDPPEVVGLYLMVFMVPVLGVPALWSWTWPQGLQWLCVIGLGGCGALAHFSMARAFCCSDVTFLIPFGATRPVVSALIGFFCFAQIPGSWTIVGSSIILSAALFLGRYETRDWNKS